MDKLIGSPSLTTVVLALQVRLLTVALLELPVALRLVGPDHQTRVAPTDSHQKAVVMAPAHVGNVCAVCQVAFELCVLALEDRRTLSSSPQTHASLCEHRLSP